MKKRINTRFMLVASVAIILTMCFATYIFYDTYKIEVIEEMKAFAHILKDTQAFEDSNIEYQKGSFDDSDIRVTVVDSEGNVIYDSQVLSKQLDNHMRRPEIQKAVKNGESYEIRESKTLSKNTFYYAILLDNGSILRISKDVGSLINIIGNMIPYMILVAVILISVCFAVSHFLTKSILEPINKMADNINEIDNVDGYKELAPFMTTIKRQHADIIKNAMMRQEFTANVSHELKTPLTSISGYSELISSGMAEDEDVKRFAIEIHNSAKRLLTLINDIIKLSELDYMESDIYFEKVNLHEATKKCVNSLKVNADKHNVSIEYDGEDAIIDANSDMIDELIYNLCDNAIRYNKPEGKVFISVKKDKDSVILRVQDTGIGIAKEHQVRVFERFYRVDKSRSKSTGGTGLGLAIVKHIVANLRANLILESEEGVGTTITIKFKVE